MNYTITEATLDDVPDIVEITMVSFLVWNNFFEILSK